MRGKIMLESEYSENMDEREQVLNRFDSITLSALEDSDEVTPETKVVDILYHIQARSLFP